MMRQHMMTPAEAIAAHEIIQDTSKMGAWTEDDKRRLLELVDELQPCGSTDWEVLPFLH